MPSLTPRSLSHRPILAHSASLAVHSSQRLQRGKKELRFTLEGLCRHYWCKIAFGTFRPFCKFVNPQAWELALSITPGCLPLLRGETTDAVFLLEVLSSNSYRLTSSYLLTRHQRAVPLTKIIVYYTPFSPSSVHPYESTTSTHRGTFVCRADV